MAQLLRYGLVAAGPMLAALAQFLLSILLVRQVDTAAFGGFALLLLLAQLGQGVWGAMFCAPLLLCLDKGRDGQGVVAIRAVAGIAAPIAGLAIAGVALALKFDGLVPPMAGLFCWTLLGRWMARSHAMAAGYANRAIESDLIFAFLLLVLIGIASIFRPLDVSLALAILAFSGFCGWLAVAGCVRAGGSALADLRMVAAEYRSIWQRHASWSLVGVMTTEVTANAHAYFVSLFLGPAAYAPLAATALLIRPVGVGMNAVMDFERATMARMLSKHKCLKAVRTVVQVRGLLVLGWAGCVVAAVALVASAPRLLFPETYALTTIEVGAVLWFAVALARLLRAGESAFLQASGAFRPLALASVAASMTSLVGVALILLFAAPVWSILGVVFGEVVFTLWTLHAAGRRMSAIRWKASL